MELNFPIEKLETFMTLLNNIPGKPKDYIYEYQVLKVRIRVVMYYNDKKEGGSVYCFIDSNGNLLFPAGWTTPTKSSPIRGSILNANPLQKLQWTGLPYLR